MDCPKVDLASRDGKAGPEGLASRDGKAGPEGLADWSSQDGST